MGNNKSKFGIYIKTQMTFYLPGQLVQGNIYINAPKPHPINNITLTISGTQNIWWKTQNQNQNQKLQKNGVASNQKFSQKPNQLKARFTNDRQSQKTIFNNSCILKDYQKNSNIHGQFTFPFEFRLPRYLPGSFKQATPDHKASIIYQITCTCFSSPASENNVTETQQLIIREPQKGPEKLLFGQEYIYPHTCGCFQHGVSRVCCTFEKNQFIPGQDCVIKCQVDNYKCKLNIKKINIKFIKIVTLTSGFGQQKSFITDINSSTFPGVQASSQYIEANSKKIIFPLKFKKQLAPLHPNTNGNLVKCKYSFQITPILSGCCISNVNSMKIEIQIIQQGLPYLQIEKPVDWNPQVYRKSQIILDCPLTNNKLESF